jgi:hypothetical protein
MLDLPLRYSELDRRRNAYPAAAPPCAIPGCTYLRRVYYARAGDVRRWVVVYDHCHIHDRIRGVLCRDCNNAMTHVDAGVDLSGVRSGRKWAELWPAFLAYWERCPECLAGGPWERRMTWAELVRGDRDGLPES